MFNIKVFNLLIVCVCLARVQGVYFTDCGSLLKVSEVNIEGCSKESSPSDRCLLQLGSTTSVNFRFHTASSSAGSLTQQVFLVLREIFTEVPVTPDEPCSSIGCPLSPESDREYNATLDLTAPSLVVLPPLDYILYWKIQSGEGDLMCIYTEVRLLAPQNDDSGNSDEMDVQLERFKNFLKPL